MMGQNGRRYSHDQAAGLIPRKDKVSRYVHLGMTLDRVRDCGEWFNMYDLIHECDAREG